MALAPLQEDLLLRAAALIHAGNKFRDILFVGPRGSGKQTLGRELADYLGMEFVPVPMDAPAHAIQEVLFGTAMDARRASEGGLLPGVFGLSEPTLVYLDKLHGLAPDLFMRLQQVISRRVYFAADGAHYRVSKDLALVAGLRDREPDAQVTPEHFLSTSFGARVDIVVPSSDEDLLSILKNIILDVAPERVLSDTVRPLLRDIVNGQDHLHSLRRLVRFAVNRSPSNTPIDNSLLELARSEDIEYQISRIEYRGRPIALTDFYRWQSQFPTDLHPLTIDIVRHIAEYYFVSQRSYWDSLDRMAAESDLTSTQRVVFCLWQPLGKSNAAVMHDVRTHQKLRAAQHIDLTASPSLWPRISSGPPPAFVIVDDFIGTGETICRLWESDPRPLMRLLNDYPKARAIVIAVAALDAGARRVEESLSRNFGKRVQLCVGRRFDEGDRCFSDVSRAFPDPGSRARFRDFCEEAGKKFFPPKFRFGYEGSESLVVLPDTVPNNSLPILWHDQGDWFPLFPASGRR